MADTDQPQKSTKFSTDTPPIKPLTVGGFRKAATTEDVPEPKQQPAEPEPPKNENIKEVKNKTSKESKGRTTAEPEEQKKLSVYMPPETHLKFKMYAVSHRDDMNAIINRLVEKLLQDEEKKKL